MAAALELQKMSFHRCIAPLAIVDDASWTCTAVDTSGAKAVHCLIHMGANDIAIAALKVQESNALDSATALTSGTDITGADFTVSPATVPSATDDNKFWLVTIPVTGARKRYFNLVATNGNGTVGGFLTACWIKESLDEAPGTATQRNLDQHLIVAG